MSTKKQQQQQQKQQWYTQNVHHRQNNTRISPRLRRCEYRRTLTPPPNVQQKAHKKQKNKTVGREKKHGSRQAC